MNNAETANKEDKLLDEEIRAAHKKVWKQNMWEDFQRFIAFDVIPFAVIALIVGCFVLGSSSAIVMLINAVSN